MPLRKLTPCPRLAGSFCILTLGPILICATALGLGEQLAIATDANPPAKFIHGTIVVVISTRDGFVLAGDSRGSYADNTPAPGEFEKVFSFRRRSGIVIAGRIEGADPTGELLEAVATNLHIMDSLPGKGRATSALLEFVLAVRKEIGLTDPDTLLDSSVPVAEASAVSVDENGAREWLTIFLVPTGPSHLGSQGG